MLAILVPLSMEYLVHRLASTIDSTRGALMDNELDHRKGDFIVMMAATRVCEPRGTYAVLVRSSQSTIEPQGRPSRARFTDQAGI